MEILHYRRIFIVSFLIPCVICSSLDSHIDTHDVNIGDEKGSFIKDFKNRESGSEFLLNDKGKSLNEESSESEKKEIKSHEEEKKSGHFNEKDSATKGHDIGRQSEGESKKIDQSEHSHEKHDKGQEKKGYHRSGFVNKYHKDESSDNSSYYEDSDNQKGHKGYEGRNGQNYEKAADSYKDDAHDRALSSRNNVNHGVYDKGKG